jgi:hypothetical protein
VVESYRHGVFCFLNKSFSANTREERLNNR